MSREPASPQKKKKIPGLIFTAGGQRSRQIFTISLPETDGRERTPPETAKESGRTRV